MDAKEALHSIIDKITEEERLELLKDLIVRYYEFLPPLTDEKKQDSEELLKRLLLQRYVHYKRHPETAISTEESTARLRKKYGWTATQNMDSTE